MELSVQVLPCDRIEDEHLAVLEAMYQREFGWDRLIYAAPQWMAMGLLPGRLIGRVSALEREVSVAGGLLRVGGITGVVIVLGPTTYAQPDGPRTCPGLTMVHESGSRQWPEGPIDLRGLPW
jgi:hypothetical protein